MHTIDPAARQAFIVGLRELASYLAANPDVPVPSYGTSIDVHVAETENGGREKVNEVAALLGTRVDDETADDGHYTTTRDFGPVAYRIVSIPQTYQARYEAYSSYWGCVTPDTQAGSNA
jgi:hypothetical protein